MVARGQAWLLGGHTCLVRELAWLTGACLAKGVCIAKGSTRGEGGHA